MKERVSLLGAIVVAVVACCTACSTRPSAPPLPGVVSAHDLEAGVHVAGLAVAPSGDVWLATLNYGNGPAGVIRVRMNGDVKRFSRPESFNRVAVDANGIAWFTVGAGASGQQPKLVRVERSGQMREYPLPVEGSFQGIAIGPDGVPWFVDAAGGEIGRIASDGNITYYGPVSSDPTEIAAGGDGNLWFSEPTGNRVGRLSPNGALKEFRIPTPVSRPTDLTLGADGNIWFCESAADKIGRVTPSGRVSEFRLPTAGAWPAGIAAARNGTLWFTELVTGKIGRITRNGGITEYDVPGGGYPGPIARAPDGSLWVASNAKRDAVLGLTTSRSRLVRFAPR